MRNPKRIFKLLNEFKKLWLRNPDLRFGQIIYMLAQNNRSGNILEHPEIFNPEDTLWLKWLESENLKHEK